METKEIQEKARHFLEGERKSAGLVGDTEQIEMLDYLLTLIRGEQEVGNQRLVRHTIAFNRTLSILAQIYGAEDFPDAPDAVRSALTYGVEISCGIREWVRQEDDGNTPEEQAIIDKALVSPPSSPMEVLDAIRVYASDALSGRADSPTDMEWLRDAFREIVRRVDEMATSTPTYATEEPEEKTDG